MRFTKHLTTWLLLLAVLMTSGLVSAKVASGVQNLTGGVHQENIAANALMHLAKIDYSVGVASGSPVVTKSVEQGRDSLGRFLPKNGGDIVPGSAGEQAVWNAVKNKPGWNVIEGRVSVRNAGGQLRVYDGAAVSPRGRTIGLEVKTGSATKTAAQRNFDGGVNTYNPAVGVGQSSGVSVGRSLEIRVP